MVLKYKHMLSVLSLMVMPLAGWSQLSYTFRVDAVGYPADALHASVTVTFGGAGSILDGFVTVDITNLGETDSLITQFYLLRPFDDMGNGFGGTLNSTDPSSWLMDNSWGAAPAGLSGSDYFGMHVDDSPYDPLAFPPNNSEGYPQSGSFMFLFSKMFGSSLAGSAWHNSEAPLIFLQWESVGDSGATGFGFAGGPNFNFAVPEPGSLALLSVLGLGGLLWSRRRLLRK